MPKAAAQDREDFVRSSRSELLKPTGLVRFGVPFRRQEADRLGAPKPKDGNDMKMTSEKESGSKSLEYASMSVHFVQCIFPVMQA